MTMVRRPILAMVCVILASAAVQAEPPTLDENGLSVGIYDVSSLTAGHRSFLEHGPGVERDDSDSERSRLAFEEPFFPHGMAEELIELIKMGVEPAFWEETAGAAITTNGECALVVRASPEVHDLVGAFLSDLDRSPTMHVDLCVARLPAARQAAWAAQESHDALPDLDTPLLATVATVGDVQSTIFRGDHRLIVQGQQAVLFKGVAVTLPNVAVARYGLTATVDVVPIHGDNQFSLTVKASLARHVALSSTSGIDLSRDAIATWRGNLVATAHEWHLIGTAGESEGAPWALFARVHTAFEGTKRSWSTTWIATDKRESSSRVMRSQRYNIKDLQQQMRSSQTTFEELFSPASLRPEPEELPESEPKMNAESLVELIQSVMSEATWEEGTINAQNGWLIVRNRFEAHEAIVHILASLRQGLHRTLAVDVQVYEVATAGLPTDAAEILAKLKDLEPQTSARVRCDQAFMNFARAGSEHRFVDHYEIEALEGKYVALPFSGNVFLGLVAQARVQTSFRGGDALLELRVSQQALASERTIESGQGPLTLPTVNVFRGKTTLRAPLGQPAIAFRADEGTTTRIVTVTTVVEK